MMTQEKIKEYCYYNEYTGGLHWIKTYMKRKENDRCGCVHSRGYRHVPIEYKSYKEHILIWVYHHGVFPIGHQIDHINNIRDCNFIWNLRLVNGFENQQNRGKNKNNTIGYKGVEKNKNSFIASIMFNRNRIRMSGFKTKEAAALEYNKLAVRYHGEFANLNIIGI